MNEENNNMIHDVRDRPPILKWFLLSLQHVFAMFGATVLVPIIVNSSVHAQVLTVPVALLCSGLGTLIYILCTKGKSPVYLGSSFAFITPMIVGFSMAGKSGVLSALMVVGLVYVLIALIIHFVGKDWVNKLLPPIVVGPMIMIIGLSLAPNAVSQIGLDQAVISTNNLIVAFVAFLVTILAARSKKGVRVIPFLLGIIAGYIVSLFLGMIDVTPIKQASILSLPYFYIPLINYQFNTAAFLTIVPIALVTMVEHVGDHKVLSEIIGRDLIQDPGLDKTLLGDGLATFFSAFLGGPANTTYGENTSVVGMTKVASVHVIALAAVIAILFSFSGHLTQILKAIPDPVLGGVSILLYGFITVNGLKILINHQIDFNNIKNVIIVATMLILGLGGALLSFKYAIFPFLCLE